MNAVASVCPICARPMLARCPDCGYHPAMVAEELLGIAERLIVRMNSLPAGSAGRRQLYPQIAQAAKLAGRSQSTDLFAVTLVRLGASECGGALPLAQVIASPAGRISVSEQPANSRGLTLSPAERAELQACWQQALSYCMSLEVN